MPLEPKHHIRYVHTRKCLIHLSSTNVDMLYFGGNTAYKVDLLIGVNALANEMFP